MLDIATTLFKKVYQDTNSIEAALLEMKRIGYNESDAITVLMRVFEVTAEYAQKLTTDSIAWSA